MPVSQPSTQRGLVVTAAALGINLILGTLYAWGVMGKALVVQWKWSKFDAALPFAVSTAAFAITMVFAGRAQDKVGPKWVAAFGGVIFGGGLLASAWATSPFAMMLTFGLVGGIGIGLGYSATTPPAIKWFPAQKKGLVAGIVVSGVGLASVYMAPTTQFLLERFSIGTTFLLLGGGAVAIICLLSMLLANPPAAAAVAGTGATAGSTAGGVAGRKADAGGGNQTGAGDPRAAGGAGNGDKDWNEMLRTPQFYVLWLTYVLGAAAGLMIISNVAIIAKEQAAWEAGFVPVMTLAIFNTVGRVLSGYLSDSLGRALTLALAFLLQAANMVCFCHYGSPALLVFGAAFTGLCYGAIFTLMPAATADFYGTRHLGVNYGIVFTGFGVAGVLGSLLGGKVRDLLGSYSTAYYICAGMLLVAAALTFSTRKKAIG